MTKSLKINLMLVLMLLLSTITLFFCMLNTDGVKQAAADEEITVPTTYTVADKSDFYFIEGAQVNIEATGIRFKAEITKGYYDELTNNGTEQVVFYAVVNGSKASAENAQIKPFTVQPTFASGAEYSETFSLYVTIKYDTYVPTNGTYDKAYMTELVADAYALKADNTWVKAFVPENNQRSMRIVANAAYLMQLEGEANGEVEDDVEYKEKLSKYFKSELTTRTDDEMAYVLSDGSGKMILPELTNDSYIGAYIGTKNVASAITDNVITLANVDLTDKVLGDLQNITALTKNGGLYTMKVAYATGVLTASNIGTTLLGGASGYYVLGEDINMATSATDGVNTSVTWGSTTSTLAGDFSGTLNGLGYTLKNITTSTASGLFKTVKDVRLINFNITGKLRGATGILAANAYGKCEIDNVYAKIDRNGQTTVGLIRDAQKDSVINVSNTVVEYTDGSTNANIGYYISRVYNATINLGDNVYGIAGAKLAVGTATNNGTTNGKVATYDDRDYFIADYANNKAVLSGVITNYFSSLYTAVNQENCSTLLATATSGYFVLTSNITLPSTWAHTGTFNGTLNGAGYNITVENTKGIFNTLLGTVKNVCILMTGKIQGQYGAIAHDSTQTKNSKGEVTAIGTLKDVFIKVNETIGEGGGAIIGRVRDGLKLDNVVVNTTMDYSEKRGSLVGIGYESGTATISATNVYIISKLGLTANVYSRIIDINGTLIDSDDDKNLTGEITSITGINVFKTTSDFGKFYETDYSNLTTFLQGQCESVLGCAKESASSN